MRFPKVHKIRYNIDMKKSGNIINFDPTDTSWATNFLECATLFRIVGWFSFFEKITGFNPKVSYRFSQNFINDTVKFDTLKFVLIEDLIAEATRVSRDGELWFKKILSVSTPMTYYYQEMKP